MFDLKRSQKNIAARAATGPLESEIINHIEGMTWQQI